MDCESGHIVGCALGGVVFERLRGGGEVVAHHVRDNNAEVQGQEEGDLVAPAVGKVGPAVDQEDCSSRGGSGLGEKVVVVYAVEEDMVVLDTGIGGRDFAWCHCDRVFESGERLRIKMTGRMKH